MEMNKVNIKRTAAVLLVFAMLFGLCACGKSDNAKLADSLIAEIGTVNKNSDQSISRAENVVARLSDEEKKTLDGLETLEQARHDYDMLFAQEVIDLIDGLDETATTIGDDISAADKAYNALSDSQKELVANYGDLEQARFNYNMQYAQVVIDLINDIGELSYGSEDAIAAAEKAYDALTDGQKILVTNYGVMTAARDNMPEARIKSVEKMIDELNEESAVEDYERVSEIMSTMSKKDKDKISNLEDFNIKYAATLLTDVKLWFDADRVLRVYFNFKNNCDKTIKYMYFTIQFYNTVDDLQFVGNDIESRCEIVGPYAPGEGLKGEHWRYSYYTSQLDTYHIGRIELTKLEIEYTDGTKVTFPAYAAKALLG